MKRRTKPLRYLIVLSLLLATAVLVSCGQTNPSEPSGPYGDSVSDIQTEPTDVTVPQPSEPEPDLNPQTLINMAEEQFRDFSPGAKHIIVYDLTSNTKLYEKDARAQITAASTTKLLTALTALDYISSDTLFTVGTELSFVAKDASTAHLKRGQILTAEQVLDAMLIPSGNDAAYVLAIQVGRQIADDPQCSDKTALSLFLTKMNEKAISLGAENSKFTCPDGYPDSEQYTTPEDMLNIALQAATRKEILSSCTKTYAEYSLIDGTVLELTTTNQLLLPSSPYYYEGATGLKTGSTPKAGQCVCASANLYGHTVIVALFNAPTNDARWKDCRNAFDRAGDAIRAAKDRYTPNAEQ